MSSFDPPQPPSDRQKSPKCLRWRLLLLLFSFWKFRVGVEGSFGGGGGVLCDVPEPLLLLLGNSEGGRRGKRGFLHLVHFPPCLQTKRRVATGENASCLFPSVFRFKLEMPLTRMFVQLYSFSKSVNLIPYENPEVGFSACGHPHEKNITAPPSKGRSPPT